MGVEMMQSCYVCKGNLLEEQVNHIHLWGEKILLFEDVPAEVCQQCGETYFRSDVLELIDAIASSDIKPTKTISVPVFSVSDETNRKEMTQ